MTRTTAAVAWRPGGLFAIEEVMLAEPGKGEVRVSLAVSGVCHTDLTVRDGLMPIPLPAVLGHEGAGVIEEAGEGVSDLEPGMRVALTTDFCGTCANCRGGRTYCCVEFARLNMTGLRPDGTTAFRVGGTPVGSNFFGQSSFSAHVVVRANAVIPIPDDIPFPLVAPMVCGVLSGAGAILNPPHTGPAEPLAVFGLGTVGLAAIMAARIRGLGTIIAIDPVAARRELASGLGATHVIDPSAADPAESILEVTGTGAQYSLECSGARGVLEQALRALGPGGYCGIIGATPAGTTVTLDPQQLIGSHQSLGGIVLGGSAARTTLPRLIDYWREGRLPVERIVRVFEFEQINDAVAAAQAGEVVKPVLRF